MSSVHRYLRGVGLREVLQRTPTALEIENADPEVARFCSLVPLLSPKSKPVYCGTATPLSARLFRELSKDDKWFFLADTKGALEFGAVPGPSTHFSPYFPSYSLKVLANASSIVTFHPEIAHLAVHNRIPCVFIETAGMKRPTGLPVVAYEGRITSMARRVESLLRSQPPRVAVEPLLAASGHAPVHLASISDIYYLPFLLGFIENAWEANSGNVQFHILALDKEVSEFLRAQYPQVPIHCYHLDDLWSPVELPTVLSRGTGYRAFSSKPKLIAKARERAQATVVYCDSDVFFFDPPRKLAESLDSYAGILFPHWNDEDARADGLFNAGMMVIGAGADKFLDWWGSRTFSRCDRGTVGDQGYLDEASIRFPELGIYRGKDQDVARWNIHSLGVHWDPASPERPLLEDKRPISTYHGAFIDSFGFFEAKWSWDAIVTYFSPYAKTAQAESFLSTVLHQQEAHWLSLSRAIKLQDTFLSRWMGRTPSWDFQIRWVRAPFKTFLRFFLSFRDVGRSLFPLTSKSG